MIQSKCTLNIKSGLVETTHEMTDTIMIKETQMGSLLFLFPNVAMEIPVCLCSLNTLILKM